MRIAIYALGCGHASAMRGLALARALQERVSDDRRVAAHCLVLTRDSMKAWSKAARVPTAVPPPMAHRDSLMLAEWVQASLRDFAPDVLVVDTFARGLLGELGAFLPTLAPRRILLSPWVSPRYLLRPDVSQAVVEAYDALLWCEPPPDGLDALIARCRRVERVPPVLFVRPQDVESATSGRQAFGVHEMERIVLGLGSGDAATERGQLDALVAASRQPGMRFSVMFCAHHLPPTESPGVRVVRIFPAGAWLRSCPVVVAAAGYQSYYEVVQAQVPAVFRPLPRPLDDQARRAAGGMGLVPFAPHAVVDDDARLGAAIRPLLENALRRRFGKRALSDDVEMRASASGGAAAAAEAVIDIVS